MTVNEILVQALDPLGIPLYPDVYLGEDAAYFVFTYSSVGDAFADDRPGVERHLISLHYYGPLAGNPLRLIDDAKRALFQAGTTWPQTTHLSDENRRHIVLECEIEMGVGLDG